MTAGKTIRSDLLGADLVLERARPFEVHAARQVSKNFCRDDALRLLDEADFVAAADAELDVGAQQAVLALDHRRPLDDLDVGDCGQRDLNAAWLGRGAAGEAAIPPAHAAGRPASVAGPAGGDEDVLEGLDVVAVIAGVADAHRVALAALDRHRQRPCRPAPPRRRPECRRR